MDVSPFDQQEALDQSKLSADSGVSGSIDHLPDTFHVSLQPENISRFLLDELQTPVIEELYPHLWMVAKRKNDHVDALHGHHVKGREIIVSEDPSLHLVWTPRTIFVKPIPRALLNFQVWSEFLPTAQGSSGYLHSLHKQKEQQSTSPDIGPQSEVLNARRAACGFLRSYAFIIRYPSDLKIAQQKLLVPEDIGWVKWQRFISRFALLDDACVSPRYHYGQLRLSRLDWVIRLFRPVSSNSIWFYHIPYWSITTYLRYMLAPLIFLFASVSVFLSCMQVMLSWSGTNDGTAQSAVNNQSLALWVIPLIFAILTVLSWILILTIPFSVLLWQLSWGYRNSS